VVCPMTSVSFTSELIAQPAIPNREVRRRVMRPARSRHEQAGMEGPRVIRELGRPSRTRPADVARSLSGDVWCPGEDFPIVSPVTSRREGVGVWACALMLVESGEELGIVASLANWSMVAEELNEEFGFFSVGLPGCWLGLIVHKTDGRFGRSKDRRI